MNMPFIGTVGKREEREEERECKKGLHPPGFLMRIEGITVS